MEYIIDGTNICNVNGEKSLTPLINLVLGLMDRKASFICYFDFTTKRSHLKSWMDRRIYDLIVTQSPSENASAFWGNGLFIQAIQIEKADDLILRRARDLSHALIISRDLFKQEIYEDDYGWSNHDRKHRLCTVDIINHELLVVYKGKVRIKRSYESDLLKLATELINRLEEENGTLEGKLLTYDDQKRVGRIELPEKRKRKVRFRDTTVRNSKLNYRQKGLEVTFELEPHIIRNDPPKDNFILFEAANIQEIEDAKTALKRSREHILNLSKELEEVKDKLVQEESENLTLKEEVKQTEALRNQIHELQISGDSSKAKELEKLLAENGQQKLRIEKLEADEKAYKREIDSLKARIDVLESLTEFYQSPFQDSSEGVKEFWFDNKEREDSERMFSIYEGTGLHKKSKAKEKMVDENQYLTKISLLEQEIGNLKAEITAISKQNTIYSSRMRTFVRYGYTGYYPQGNMIEFLNQKIQELEDTVRQLQRTQNIEPEIVFSSFDDSHMSVDETENQSNLQREKVVYFDIPYEDDEILDWWNHLPPNWRHAFERKFVIPKPLNSVEELYRIFRAKSLKFIGADYPMSMGFGVALPFVLEELSGLNILHDIEEINLSFNRITNIVGLLHLKKLRKLNLTHNKIKHIHHLNKLPALESLDLSSNPIDHQEVEDLKKTFPDVHIEFR